MPSSTRVQQDNDFVYQHTEDGPMMASRCDQRSFQSFPVSTDGSRGMTSGIRMRHDAVDSLAGSLPSKHLTTCMSESRTIDKSRGAIDQRLDDANASRCPRARADGLGRSGAVAPSYLSPRARRLWGSLPTTFTSEPPIDDLAQNGSNSFPSIIPSPPIAHRHGDQHQLGEPYQPLPNQNNTGREPHHARPNLLQQTSHHTRQQVLFISRWHNEPRNIPKPLTIIHRSPLSANLESRSFYSPGSPTPQVSYDHRLPCTNTRALIGRIPRSETRR